MPSRPRAARRWGLGALLVVGMCLAAGCSPDPSPTPTRTATPTLTADEAWEKYGELATELNEAIPSTYPELNWTIEDPFVGASSDGSECSLNLGRVHSAKALPLVEDEEALGDAFSRVRTALDPILERHGFSPLGESERDDAYMIHLYSRTPDGLTFRLSTRNFTEAKLPSIPLDPATCIPGDYTPPPSPDPSPTDG